MSLPPWYEKHYQKRSEKHPVLWLLLVIVLFVAPHIIVNILSR